MAVAIAGLSGCRNKALLGTLGILTATTMGMGYMVEQQLRKQPSAERNAAVVVATGMGWASMATVWAIIGNYFFKTLKASNGNAPAWLKAVFWSQLALFGSFGVIQGVQVLRHWRRPARDNFATYEKAYIGASFTAKALLAGLVVGGIAFGPDR